MSESVYVLDSEGLSQAVLGNRLMGARLKDADRSGIRVVTSSMTFVAMACDRASLHSLWT